MTMEIATTETLRRRRPTPGQGLLLRVPGIPAGATVTKWQLVLAAQVASDTCRR